MGYYFANQNVQQGPFELNELLSKGLRPDSLVWTDGMKDWIRADSVAEVAALFTSQEPAGPPAVPPTEPTTPPLQPLGTLPYHPAMTAPTDGMAVASLVLGILSVLLMCARGLGLLMGIFAIVLGFIARGRPQGRNSGMALAGIILGFVALVFGGFVFCISGGFLLNRGSHRLIP